jgi:hypothetical protein
MARHCIFGGAQKRDRNADVTCIRLTTKALTLG